MSCNACFFANRRVGLPVISLCSRGSTTSAGYTVWLSVSGEWSAGGKQSDAVAVCLLHQQSASRIMHTSWHIHTHIHDMRLYRIYLHSS